MKNLLFLIGAAIIVSISACGKTSLGLTGGSSNSSTSNINTNNLISQWFYTTDTVNYYTGSTLDSSKTYAYFQSDNIQFNSNGSGVEMRSNVSTAFTFGITDLEITFLFPDTKVNAVIVPRANAVGIRTLASSGTTVKANIKALTTTTLVLVFNTVTGSNTTTTETAHFSN